MLLKQSVRQVSVFEFLTHPAPLMTSTLSQSSPKDLDSGPRAARPRWQLLAQPLSPEAPAWFPHPRLPSEMSPSRPRARRPRLGRSIRRHRRPLALRECWRPGCGIAPMVVSSAPSVQRGITGGLGVRPSAAQHQRTRRSCRPAASPRRSRALSIHSVGGEPGTCSLRLRLSKTLRTSRVGRAAASRGSLPQIGAVTQRSSANAETGPDITEERMRERAFITGIDAAEATCTRSVW